MQLHHTVQDFSFTEDPRNKYRIACNETALVSEIPSVIYNENIIVAPGQGKHQLQLQMTIIVKNRLSFFLFLMANLDIHQNVKRK